MILFVLFVQCNKMLFCFIDKENGPKTYFISEYFTKNLEAVFMATKSVKSLKNAWKLIISQNILQQITEGSQILTYGSKSKKNVLIVDRLMF